MENKSNYESPEIQFILLDDLDIVSTSGGGIGEDPGHNDGEWM